MKVSTDVTREFKLDGVDLGGEGVVTLTVRHAGESNPPFWSAALKQSNEQRNRTGNSKVTAASIAAIREADCRLFSKFVIVNWANVYEDDGKGGVKLAEFDTLKCEEFLTAIAENAPDVFNALKSYITDADNFRTTASVDGAELGKR